MHTRLCGVICIVFAFCLVASPALAEREVIVKPLDTTIATPFNLGTNAQPTQPCVVGNLNPLAFAITGFAAPPEQYALVYDPQLGCSSCLIGHKVNTIHILMRTSAACDVVMAVDVQEISNVDPACPDRSPGPELCNSGLFTVNLPGANIWDVAIPITCDCIDMNRLYLISFEYESSSCLPEPDLITDGLPSVCTSWNNFGQGWLDLVTTFGFPGNLSFYADADCCEPPVPVESKTWGEIKSLYDDK